MRTLRPLPVQLRNSYFLGKVKVEVKVKVALPLCNCSSSILFVTTALITAFEELYNNFFKRKTRATKND